MPTTESQRRRWAEAETQRLVEEAGLSVQDAQLVIDDLMRLIPVGEDPATYQIPAIMFLNLAEVTDKDIIDARADWWASEDVADSDRRMLDAIPED